MSVAVQPGQTAFTRIPVPLNSAASTRVSAFRAAFVVEYAGVPAPIEGSEPASEDTLTIRPHPAFRIIGANAWAIRHAPNTFTSNASRTTFQSAFSTFCQVS